MPDKRVPNSQFELPKECHSKISGIFEYWSSIPRASGLPARRQVDPIDISPKLLPNIMLIEPDGVPPRFRFRLLGTGITRFAGRDNTGKWMHQLYDDFEGNLSHQALCRVVRDGVPDYRSGRPVNVKLGDWVYVERIYLPLAENGRTVDMILGLTVFQNTQGQIF